MFQFLWLKNISHKHGGKLKGTNWIKHMPRRSKSAIFQHEAWFYLLTSRGHSGRQRPLLSREPPSVWPASLWIDRGAPWQNRTGIGGFGKPCHVERSFNLPNKHNVYWKNTDYLPPVKPNICLNFFPASVRGMIVTGGNCWVLLASHLNPPGRHGKL